MKLTGLRPAAYAPVVGETPSDRQRIVTMDFEGLERFLASVPGVRKPIGTGIFDSGRWWAKFAVDIDHPLAWRVVQEFGHVLNYKRSS